MAAAFHAPSLRLEAGLTAAGNVDLARKIVLRRARDADEVRRAANDGLVETTRDVVCGGLIWDGVRGASWAAPKSVLALVLNASVAGLACAAIGGLDRAAMFGWFVM